MISEAWANQLPQTGSTSSGPYASGAATYRSSLSRWRLESATVGLLTLERGRSRRVPPRRDQSGIGAGRAPRPCDWRPPCFFEEVRSLATNEERQRLAREIHDGVAQELVMVGYGIDNTLAVLPDAATRRPADELRSLRSEVTPRDH